jgi:proline iminopeptidase
MHIPAAGRSTRSAVLSRLLATVLLSAAAGTACCTAAPSTRATPLPTVDGVPVYQWYLRTEDDVAHYVAEFGPRAASTPTVVVLHGGWGAEHSYLLPALLPMANEFRVVMYDQRGSLRTPVTPPAQISYAALVDDLEQLRQRLGLDKLTLLAHSMGNHLAYGYLLKHPDRVAGLVLVGPTTPAPFGEAKPGFLADVWPDFSEADAQAIADRQREYDRGVFRRAVRIAADEGLVPAELGDVQPGTPGVREAFDAAISTDQQKTDWWRIQFTCVNTFDGRNWRTMIGGQSFYSPAAGQAVLEDPQYQAAIPQYWQALKAFRGPVRVIIGTHDYVDLGPTMWPKLITPLSDARLTVINNAGHSLWMDNPRAVDVALRSALREATGTR